MKYIARSAEGPCHQSVGRCLLHFIALAERLAEPPAEPPRLSSLFPPRIRWIRGSITAGWS